MQRRRRSYPQPRLPSPPTPFPPPCPRKPGEFLEQPLDEPRAKRRMSAGMWVARFQALSTPKDFHDQGPACQVCPCLAVRIVPSPMRPRVLSCLCLVFAARYRSLWQGPSKDERTTHRWRACLGVVRAQVWSGHPCNWHITEPVEVGDYQVPSPAVALPPPVNSSACPWPSVLWRFL